MGRGQGTLLVGKVLATPDTIRLSILSVLPDQGETSESAVTASSVEEISASFPELTSNQVTGKLRNLIGNKYVVRKNSKYYRTTRGRLAAEKQDLNITWTELVDAEMTRIGAHNITVDREFFSNVQYNNEPVLKEASLDIFSLINLLALVPDNSGDERLVNSLHVYETGYTTGYAEADERDEYCSGYRDGYANGSDD
jgi:hypothetical protein